MHAQSLVVTTRRLEDAVDDVFAHPRVSSNAAVRDRGLAALSALCTLDALVAASAPLPVPDRPSDGTGDEAITSLVERMYDDGGLSTAAVDEGGFTGTLRSGRVRRVGGAVVVPLTAEADAVHNWGPVYNVLFDALARIADRCDRICARFDSELSGSTVACRIWESCAEMVRETRDAVRIQLSRQQRLCHMYDRSPDEPGQFAEWTLDQLTDIQTES